MRMLRMTSMRNRHLKRDQSEREKDASVRQGKPRLDLGDEFVDEPLSSPRLDAQLPKKSGGRWSSFSYIRSGNEQTSFSTSSELTERLGPRSRQ
jgi:hypothetical protein